MLQNISMSPQENYSVEKKGNVIILHSPEFLTKQMVDEFLSEIDNIIQKMSIDSEDNMMAINNSISKRCAIVLDFSRLGLSTMETVQMAEFVSVMSRYKFKSLVSIPPNASVFGESQVISLLNKSLPMFGKKGIRVYIENNMLKTMERVKTFPCYVE